MFALYWRKVLLALPRQESLSTRSYIFKVSMWQQCLYEGP